MNVSFCVTEIWAQISTGKIKLPPLFGLPAVNLASEMTPISGRCSLEAEGAQQHEEATFQDPIELAAIGVGEEGHEFVVIGEILDVDRETELAVVSRRVVHTSKPVDEGLGRTVERLVHVEAVVASRGVAAGRGNCKNRPKVVSPGMR